MHELAIAESLVAAVRDHTGDQPVVAVRIRVGRLAGVVPDALLFSFEVATAGSPLEGATLEIEQPAGRASCHTCGRKFELPDLILLCPCGSADVEVLSGRELSLASVEVATAEVG